MIVKILDKNKKEQNITDTDKAKSRDIVKYNCTNCGKAVTLLIKIFRRRRGNDNFLCGNCLKKQTCLKRYGVDSAAKSEKIKEKTKQACLIKYGVDSTNKLISVKEKKKQTCLKHYGVEWPFMSDVVREKSKQTCIKKYGVEHRYHDQCKN